MGPKLLPHHHHLVVNQLHLTDMVPRVIPRHRQHDVQHNICPSPVSGGHKSVLEPRDHKLVVGSASKEDIQYASQHPHIAADQRIPGHISHPVEQKPPVLLRLEGGLLHHAQQALHGRTPGLHVGTTALVGAPPLEGRVLPPHVPGGLLLQPFTLLLRASYALLVAARVTDVPWAVQHNETPLTSPCSTTPLHLQHGVTPGAPRQICGSCVSRRQRLVDLPCNGIAQFQ
mmetsp:Transcript_125387/g.287210  ORF Transcript_125387/g.287210 Transcript_125387/m.287210 type:complete len:229 (+) Transcript_125387:831-1517(+)